MQVLGHGEQVVRMNRVGHVSELLLGSHGLSFNVEAHNSNRPRGWTQYAGDGPQRRGLACAVRSNEADDFTRLHRETQVAHRREFAVMPAQIVDLDHRRVDWIHCHSIAPGMVKSASW